MKGKTLIFIGILILVAIVILNESRFVMWGPFGIPEETTRMNCGEDRYKFNYNLNSKQDFLAAIEDLKKIERSGDEVVPGYDVAHWVKLANFTLINVNERNSGSLLFNQKLYSVEIPGCQSLVFEMSENGYTSVRGCCGI